MRIVIQAGKLRQHYWEDLWRFRGLFYFLAWRDVKVRYKQTAIGIIWNVLRPLLTIGAFWFIGWMFFIPDQGVPRVLFVAAATLPWQFFSSAFSESSNSLIANSNLLTKVYFPRLIVPASTVIVCLIDFFISFAIMIGWKWVGCGGGERSTTCAGHGGGSRALPPPAAGGLLR